MLFYGLFYCLGPGFDPQLLKYMIDMGFDCFFTDKQFVADLKIG
jgi:hypothetical protein